MCFEGEDGKMVPHRPSVNMSIRSQCRSHAQPDVSHRTCARQVGTKGSFEVRHRHTTPLHRSFPPHSHLSSKCCPFLSLEPSSSVSLHLSSPRVANCMHLSTGSSDVLAFIVLGLSAYTLSQTAVAVGFYFTYSALGIATAVIHLSSVTTM